MDKHSIDLWIRVLLSLCIAMAIINPLIILTDPYLPIPYPIPYPVLHTIFLIFGIILTALIAFRAALNRESKNINMRNAISSTRVRLMVERINRKPLGFDYRDYVINQLEEALNSGSGSPSDLFTRFRLILEHIEVYENDQYKLRFSDPAKKVITEWISEKDSQFKMGDVALRELFAALSEYITGNPEDFIHIMNHKTPNNYKAAWIGALAEAFVFMDCCGFSVAQFNKCFALPGDKTLKESNRGRKPRNEYTIYPILQKYLNKQ